MTFRLALIVAKAANDVIGRGNALPWYLPNDLKYFKQVTMGKTVIMGRRTWESLKRPLPGRENVVVTRQPDYEADGARVVTSLEEALILAEHVAFICGQDEVVVIGGEQIYQQALPYMDRIYLTEVHADIEGDTHFPALDGSQWREAVREDFSAEGPNPYDYSFVVYDRTSGKVVMD